MDQKLNEEVVTELEVHLADLRTRLFQIQTTGEAKEKYSPLTEDWYQSLALRVNRVPIDVALRQIGALITDITVLRKSLGKIASKRLGGLEKLFGNLPESMNEKEKQKDRNKEAKSQIVKELKLEISCYHKRLTEINDFLINRINAEGAGASTNQIVVSWSVPILGAFLEVLREAGIIDKKKFTKKHVAELVGKTFLTANNGNSKKTLAEAMNPKYQAWDSLTEELEKLTEIAKTLSSRDLEKKA